MADPLFSPDSLESLELKKLPFLLQRLVWRTHKAGGRLLFVGGCVRDALLGKPAQSQIDGSTDWDCEIYGLSLDAVEKLLREDFSEVLTVGKSFGIFHLPEAHLDVALPRQETVNGVGHRDFSVEVNPFLSFEEASRRRDLTINSMGFDPLTGELLDPHGGKKDLEKKVLRATCPAAFVEDPLRGLRVAQFAARLGCEVDPSLEVLCASLDLSTLSSERFCQEWQKLLLRSPSPSRGLMFLKDSGLIRFFPELQALIDVPQSPKWHPEGDVWTHTLLVVDEAASLPGVSGEDRDLVIWSALCHDLGKPSTTQWCEKAQRLRSIGHEEAGVLPTQRFLRSICLGEKVVEKVKALVRWHLAPPQFIQKEAAHPAYRHLARTLSQQGVTLKLLGQLSLADHLGRGPTIDRADVLRQNSLFQKVAEEACVFQSVAPPAVSGAFLMRKGYLPSPQFKDILGRCLKIQDQTGECDPEKIWHIYAAEVDQSSQ